MEEPNAHDAAVQGLIAELQAMTRRIDGFTFISSDLSRRLIANTRVSDEFLELVALACDQSPELAAVARIDGAELRDMMAFCRAYATLASELQRLARGMRQTLLMRRAAIGKRALRAYALAKSLNRGEDDNLVVPHVAQMKVALGRSRGAGTRVAARDREPRSEAPISRSAPSSSSLPHGRDDREGSRPVVTLRRTHAMIEKVRRLRRRSLMARQAKPVAPLAYTRACAATLPIERDPPPVITLRTDARAEEGAPAAPAIVDCSTGCQPVAPPVCARASAATVPTRRHPPPCHPDREGGSWSSGRGAQRIPRSAGHGSRSATHP